MEDELIIIKDKYFLVIDSKGNRKLATINAKTLKMGKRELMVEYFEGKKLNTFWSIETASEDDKEQVGVILHKKEKYTQISHNDFFGESFSK
jgi:hypothetical protein